MGFFDSLTLKVYLGYLVLASGYPPHEAQHTAVVPQRPSSSRRDGYGSCGTAAPEVKLPAHKHKNMNQIIYTGKPNLSCIVKQYKKMMILVISVSS